MPRRHKKRNHSKKESVIEGFKRLEITEKKEPKENAYVDKHHLNKKKYFKSKRCTSEISLKTNSEQPFTHLCSRSEPSLHEKFKRNGIMLRRSYKKLRFSHEVVVMCYHKNRPPVRRIQPLADERDQQKRSYKNRSIPKPFDTMFWMSE